jgi:hypothetical protein
MREELSQLPICGLLTRFCVRVQSVPSRICSDSHVRAFECSRTPTSLLLHPYDVLPFECGVPRVFVSLRMRALLSLRNLLVLTSLFFLHLMAALSVHRQI